MGGLIIVQYNEVLNRLEKVRTQAYSCAVIHNEPIIYGHDSSAKQKAGNDSPVCVFNIAKDKHFDLRGNLSICRLW
eukprot:15342550-Ditylum_brightwellii.AAC.1